MFAHKKVLIILPARLGDTILCTPSIQLLHKQHPEIHIDAIAMTSLSADALTHNPAIKNIYHVTTKSDIKKIAVQYDAAIFLHHHDALQKFLKKLNIEMYAVPTPHKNKHPSQQTLEFIQSLIGCALSPADQKCALYPQPQHYEKINALLKQQGYDPNTDILIGCHLGCHSIAKRGWKLWKQLEHRRAWPFKNFIALEHLLREANPHIRLVLTGSNSENILGKDLLKTAPRTINLIDQTSVLDVAALMHFLKVYLTADTGPLHVASSTSVDIVALYGLNVADRSYPYPMLNNHTVFHGATMADITPKEVCEILMRNLD